MSGLPPLLLNVKGKYLNLFGVILRNKANKADSFLTEGERRECHMSGLPANG